MIDVFIAYHLPKNSEPTIWGSYEKAKTIYDVLTANGYSCFLRDPNDPTQTFEYTREYAKSSKLFLLVLNTHILNKCEEQVLGTSSVIKVLSKDGNIFQEITSFLSQYGGVTTGKAKGKIQCYCYDDLLDSDISNLHDCFNNMVAIRTKEVLLKWVKTQLIGNNAKILWTSKMAELWQKMAPPSRPSESEIEVYRKYFQKIRSECTSASPKILILGSTPEFRKLAYEYEFSTFVVDSSRKYYEQISVGLSNLVEREILVECDWTQMDSCQKLKPDSFDIIIGDLAVGNVAPVNIDKFIKNVAALLKSNGYWLGKSIYAFSQYSVNFNTIQKMLAEYETMDFSSTYAYTMYNLSVYACDLSNSYQIDFGKIYDVVAKNCRTERLLNIYNVFCGENTSFREKMSINFYIYPIYEFIQKVIPYLYFVDTDYGNDCYSGEFPLLIFKKNDNIRLVGGKALQVREFLEDIETQDIIQDWIQYIPAQYFVVQLIESDAILKDAWRNILKELRNNIVDRVRLRLNSSLCCVLDNFNDERVDSETYQIKNGDSLQEKEKNSLKTTYINAVLCYLAIKLDENYKSSTSFFHIMEKELFDQIAVGHVWQPTDAPWLSAKVCLSVLDGYDALEDKNKEKLMHVINRIIHKYDFHKHGWDCGVGSNLDTRALNCEVLLEYYDKMSDIQKGDTMTIFDDIVQSYFTKSKIYESLALYPIGEAILDAIKEDKKLHGKFFHKKLLGRIEFFSILTRIIIFLKNKCPQCVENCNNEFAFLTKALFDFTDLFMSQFNSICPKIKDEEVLAIPQIFYSIYKVFKLIES